MEYYVLQWNSLNFSYKSYINFMMKEKQISTFFLVLFAITRHIPFFFFFLTYAFIPVELSFWKPALFIKLQSNNSSSISYSSSKGNMTHLTH